MPSKIYANSKGKANNFYCNNVRNNKKAKTQVVCLQETQACWQTEMKVNGGEKQYNISLTHLLDEWFSTPQPAELAGKWARPLFNEDIDVAVVFTGMKASTVQTTCQE